MRESVCDRLYTYCGRRLSDWPAGGMTPRRASRITLTSHQLPALLEEDLLQKSLKALLETVLTYLPVFIEIDQDTLTLTKSPTPKMAASNAQDKAAITQHTDFDPTTAQHISHRAVPQQPPTIQEPDPAWPSHFATLQSRIRGALGERALSINHVGSTSVPGLPAKPVIDIDVVVADPADEGSYVSALVGEGWEHQKAGDGSGLGTGMGPEGGDRGAGLQFILREPDWHQHRFFVCADPVANVHVFGPGAPEVVRHRIFRVWLVEVSE